MIDVVSGPLAKNRDWADVWRDSPEHEAVTAEVSRLAETARNKPPSFHEDGLEFATTMSTQLKLVIARAHRSMWRSPEYLMGRSVCSALSTSVPLLLNIFHLPSLLRVGSV